MKPDTIRVSGDDENVTIRIFPGEIPITLLVWPVLIAAILAHWNLSNITTVAVLLFPLDLVTSLLTMMIVAEGIVWASGYTLSRPKWGLIAMALVAFGLSIAAVSFPWIGILLHAIPLLMDSVLIGTQVFAWRAGWEASDYALKRAREFAAQGETQKALHCLNSAIESSGPSAERAFELGNLLEATGRRDEAIDSYLMAADLTENWDITLRTTGLAAFLLNEQGDFHAACDLLHDVLADELSESKAEPTLRLQYASSLMSSRDWKESRRQLALAREGCVNIDPVEAQGILLAIESCELNLSEVAPPLRPKKPRAQRKRRS